MRRVTYILFMTCMLITACMVVGIAWIGEPQTETFPKVLVTFFVCGLASFLTWFTRIVWEIREFLSK